MKRVVTNCEDLFGPWICYELGTDWFNGRGRVIGLMEDGKGPVAAALFESHNGASILVHLAATGRNWMTRDFLWFVCYYPFMQLGVTKVIAPVESTNYRSVRFIEHFGFTLESTLKDAAPNGDLLLFTLRKEDCKWLSLRNRTYGKAQGSRRP